MNIKRYSMGFDKMPIVEQAAIVWPECSLKVGKQRIRVAKAFQQSHPDGVDEITGKPIESKEIG